MTDGQKQLLEALRGQFQTRRRWRVAMLALGRDLSQRDIARRLKVSQATVSREMQVIAQVRQDVREQQDAIRLGIACPFPAPSLN